MKLRELQVKDAPLMLEWMHDDNVLKGLQREKFINKTLEDCIRFIELQKEDRCNINFAVVDDNDVYMGTVSLKDINTVRLDAEFAIVIRGEAMGKGYGTFAMKEIINYAFDELQLKRVYWDVLENNTKAISLYNKLGFRQVEEIDDEIINEHAQLLSTGNSFLWYEAINPKKA